MVVVSLCFLLTCLGEGRVAVVAVVVVAVVAAGVGVLLLFVC